MSIRYRVSRRLALAASLPVFVLSGCYVVPVAPDGTVMHAYPVPGQVATFPSTPPAGTGTWSGPAVPAVLNVRLYPANDLANQTGILTGQVTNLMSGRGRFQFHYQGELLAGEATRVSGEERKGIASAYGPRGTFARCEYQMNTPYQGAGNCTFSNGAQYQVHIGS
jgi:hypothetical protein